MLSVSFCFQGIVVGDEILVINGELVTQLDMVFIESMLQDLQMVCLTVRSCRVDRPNTGPVLCAPDPPDAFIDSVVTSPATSSSQVLGDRLPSDSNASTSNCGKLLTCRILTFFLNWYHDFSCDKYENY